MGKDFMCFQVDRADVGLGFRRRATQKVVSLPLGSRTNRPLVEATAAVRANVAEHIYASLAKRALERTYPCIGGMRRQRYAAILADRSQLQHGNLPLHVRVVPYHRLGHMHLCASDSHGRRVCST